MVNFRLVGRGRKQQNDVDLVTERTPTLSPEGISEALEEKQGLLLSSGGDVPCTTLVPYDPNSLPQLSSTLQSNNGMNNEDNYESAVVKEEGEEESSDDNDSCDEEDDDSSNENDSNSDDDDEEEEEEEEDLTNVVEVDEEDDEDEDRAQYKDDYYGGDPRSSGGNGGGGRDAYLTWSFKRRFANKEYDLQPQPPLALQASGSDDDDDDYDNNELLLEDWGTKTKGYDGVYTRNDDDYDDYDEEKYYEDADEGAALVKKSADTPRRRRMWGQGQAQDDERKVNSFSYGEFSPSRRNNRYDMGRSNGGSTPNLNHNDNNRRRMNRSIPGLVCGVAVGVVGGVSAAAQAVSNRQNRRRFAEAIKIQAASVMAGAEGTSKRHFGNSADDDAEYDDDHAPLVCDDDDAGNGNRYGYNRRNDNYDDDDDDDEGETRGLLGFGGKKKSYQGHTCVPPPLRGNELGEYALAGQEVRGYNDPEEQDSSSHDPSSIIQRQRDKIEYLTQKIIDLEYELSQIKTSSSPPQGNKRQPQEQAEVDSRIDSSSHSSAEEEEDSDDDDDEVKCETLLDIDGNNEDRIGLLDYHNLENDSNDDDDDDHVLLPLKDVIAQEEDDLFFKNSAKFEFVEETTISTTADFATTATALTTTTTNDNLFSFSSNNVKEISEKDAFDGLALFSNDEGDNEVEIAKKTAEALGSQEEEIDDEAVEIDNEETKEPSFVGLLSKDQVERYSRHLLMKDGIGGVKGQVQLNESSVLVIGAGGIGSTVLMYLASSGIGHIGVVDFDNVETSNLHRQIIHSQNRVGMNKAKSAVETMKQLNPTIHCEVIDEVFTHHNALKMIQNYDCVVDASDNPQTRYLINDACILSKKPLVSGSAIGTEGQLTVYDHSSKSTNAPCYRCMYPNPPPSQNCQGCSDSGVLGPVPGVIGILQAIEVIKLLTRQHVGGEDKATTAASARTTMHDRILMYDSTRCTFMSIKKPPRRKNCISCGYKGNDSSGLKTMEDCYNLIKETRGPNHSNIVATSSDDNDTKQEGTLAELPDARTTLPTTISSSCTVSLLPPALSISCQDFYNQYYCKNRLQNRENQHILLDVRVKEQYEMCSLKGSINIPLDKLDRHLDQILSQILLMRPNDDESSSTVALTTSPPSSSLLPLNELQKMKKDQGVDHDASTTRAEQQHDVTIFCICRRGIASREATLQLHTLITEKGFCGGRRGEIDVKNITGGLNAWHNEVDSNFPFY